MILHSATLHEYTVEFSFSVDDTYVSVMMPHSTLLESVPDDGDLNEMVRVYVEKMFNLNEIIL